MMFQKKCRRSRILESHVFKCTPPSTGRLTPVTHFPSSEHSHAIVSPNSRAFIVPMGAMRSARLETSTVGSIPRVDAIFSHACVSVMPGITTFDRIPRAAPRNANRRDAYSIMHFPLPGKSYPAFGLYCNVHPGDDMPMRLPPSVIRIMALLHRSMYASPYSF